MPTCEWMAKTLPTYWCVATRLVQTAAHGHWQWVCSLMADWMDFIHIMQKFKNSFFHPWASCYNLGANTSCDPWLYTSKLHYHMVQLTASTKTKACWVDCKMKCIHFSNIVSHLHMCLHCSIYLTVLLGQSWREGQNQETLLHLLAMAAHTWWQIHCTLCNNRTCAQLHHPGPCTSWWSLQHQSLVNAMCKVIHGMKCKLTPSTAFPHRMEITWPCCMIISVHAQVIAL